VREIDLATAPTTPLAPVARESERVRKKKKRQAPPPPPPDARGATAAAHAKGGMALASTGEDGSGLGVIAWTFSAFFLVLLGFVGYRWYHGRSADTDLAEVGADTAAESDPPIETTPPGALDPGVDPEGELPPAASPDPQPTALSSYGREEQGIASVGITPATGEGLVVLEPRADGAELKVELADREHVLRAAPVAVALPEGIHRVSFVRGDEVSFRFLRVQAGHTRYVPAP
jgi:hypothetical protein